MSCPMTKPTKWPLCQTQTQISLGIRPVWSVFTVRIKKHWVLNYPLSTLWRLWSDWANAQADLSLCWTQRSFCWFCHEAAQMPAFVLQWKCYLFALCYLVYRVHCVCLNFCCPQNKFCTFLNLKNFILILLLKSKVKWAESSEFVSSSIPSWQISTAHAQPFRGAMDLAFCLKVPLDSLLVWASSEGSGETARMRRLAWTFAARIGDKYQIRLAWPKWNKYHECISCTVKFSSHLIILFRIDKLQSV